MKKRFFTPFILLTVGFLPAFSQQKVSYEVHGGITYARLKGKNINNYINTDTKVGFGAGLGISVPLKDRWNIKAEVNYQNIGGGEHHLNQGSLALNGYKEYLFQYLSAPVLIKFNTPLRGLGFFLGPQYSYLINGRLKEPSGYLIQVTNLKKSDIGGVVGFDYFIPMKSGYRIGLSGRYQLSVPSIHANDSKDLTLRNEALSLLMGIQF